MKSEGSNTFIKVKEFTDGKWFFGPPSPCPIVTVFIMTLLLFCFIIPYYTIISTLSMSHLQYGVAFFVPTLIFSFLFATITNPIMMGKRWPIIYFKISHLLNCFLFFIALFSPVKNQHMDQIFTLISALLILTCRALMNSYSFSEIIKYYIHRRISDNIVEERLNKIKKREKKRIKSNK